MKTNRIKRRRQRKPAGEMDEELKSKICSEWGTEGETTKYIFFVVIIKTSSLPSNNMGMVLEY
jgi:hypothetical protein